MTTIQLAICLQALFALASMGCGSAVGMGWVHRNPPALVFGSIGGGAALAGVFLVGRLYGAS